MGQFETYSYDLAGRLTSRKDFDNTVTTFTYDQLNRLLSKIADPSFNQAPITFTYNNLGQRLTMVAANGTTSYGYDNRNRLISKTNSKGSLSYTYNLVGNITSLRSTNSNGVTMDYSYDNLNRLQSAADNNSTAGQNQTAYNYDQVGNLQSVNLPNQVATTYQYNNLNRLTNVSTAKTGTTISSYAYTLGAAGNRLSVAELSGRMVNYSYDSIYRLTNETISGVSNPSLNGSVDYTYDEVGNRLSRTSTLAAVPSQSSIQVDANDRLTTDTYDNNGSTIAADGRIYTYDFEHRLIGVTAPNLVISIVYDGDGNRVSKTVNGVTTDFLVDTNNLTGYAQVVEEIQNGVVIKQYSYGLDLISQRQLIGNDRVTHYYGYDGHGSVRYLTDVNGAITDTYDYDSFGTLINQTGSTPNNYLYAGEQFDHDLNLYYNRARYLDVNRGRFWSQDEYEGVKFEPKSLHKYLYAHSDPINNIDPSGKSISLTEKQIAFLGYAILAALAAASACALQFAVSSAAADVFDVDTTTVVGPCVKRKKPERKRIFYRGTTFYDAVETVETQHIDLTRIAGNQSNFGFSPDRLGVYFTTQLATAQYYANLVGFAGGQTRAGGPGLIIAEVPERRFAQFAAKYKIVVEAPVPNPPTGEGETETLIFLHAMPEFESFAKYSY